MEPATARNSSARFPISKCIKLIPFGGARSKGGARAPACGNGSEFHTMSREREREREREHTLKRKLLLLPLVNFLRRVSTGNRAWEIFTSERGHASAFYSGQCRASARAGRRHRCSAFIPQPSTADCHLKARFNSVDYAACAYKWLLLPAGHQWAAGHHMITSFS